MPIKLPIKVNDDGVPVLDDASLGQYRNAIAKVESDGSGGYAAVGPRTKKGDRAYGRYQVMGANIPSWTREALGREMSAQEFLNSPEAQDAVFNHRFSGYVNKHGNPQDAASMWFSGRPMAQAGNRQDILGTSVPGYVGKFNAAMGGEASPAMQAAPGRFGMAVPPSDYTPVGDVIPFPDLAADPREPKALGGFARPGSFSSKWRTESGVRDYEGKVGLKPGSLQPVQPRTPEVADFSKAKARKATEVIPVKKTSSTNWLYSKEATKLGLPNRVAKAVRDKPELKPSLKAWVESLSDGKKVSPEAQLQGMRDLSKLLEDFGF